ncbi:isopentenyl-diphosphate Delta-isomerase [Clostridium aminobutyricum]|uniref:Isopentenyl-diphosphate delta-isomerase n=1 Tax=Clostridium aminobutyricum TaxID=33953 RepID=A0A939IGI6_CLOAM|nr:isopentenyl-diphosphate Delta-isomerase [Clostridium aminobutyricum]MBN7773365.1 isopentenyl-diphosphate Delta-isomerase [Clostridium aminobutyricum]
MENKNAVERNEVILVDSQDRPIGKADKMEAHRSPIRHRAFSIFLYHEAKLLLQQRAFHKYHAGGLWANTCCSHPGEEMDLLEDAKERLFEETGIRCDLKEVFSFEYEHQFEENLYEHEYDHVLIGEYNGTWNHNPEEVAAMRWISFEEVEKEVAEAPEKFVPWFKIILHRVLNEIKEVQKGGSLFAEQGGLSE